MRFHVDSQELNGAIATVIKAVAARPPLKVLEGIYINAEGSGLLLKATDLNIQIETTIPADISEEGDIVIPTGIFSEYAKRMPDKDIFIHTKDNTFFMESGNAHISRQFMPAEDYPQINSVIDDFKLVLNGGMFKRMVAATEFAVSTDSSKAILTGICVEISGDRLTFAAIDGSRLAVRTEKMARVYDDFKAVIPGKAMLDISRLITDDDEEIEINFSRTHMLLTLGTTTITVRMIDGAFVDYRRTIPQGYKLRTRISTRALCEACERAALICNENKNRLYSLRMCFSDDSLEITAESDTGRALERLDVAGQGGELTIGFDPRYVIEMLKAIKDDEVIFEMTNSVLPCVIRPMNEDDSFTYVIAVKRTV